MAATYYTAEQMHAYVLAARARQSAEVEALRDALQELLLFIATGWRACEWPPEHPVTRAAALTRKAEA